MKEVLRVCKKCKSKFDILTNDYLKTKGGFVHLDCYIQSQLNKGLSIEAINSGIEVIRETMMIEQKEREKRELEIQNKKLSAKKKQVNRANDKKEFFDYVSYKYNIAVFPKYFFTKVAAINNGTHVSVNKAIPYDDLLFMFKKQESYLDKVRMRNTTLNKELQGIESLNYDLAVIVNLYDSFLEWKHKQAIIESANRQSEDVTRARKINMNKVTKQAKTSNDDDLSELLDDLY